VHPEIPLMNAFCTVVSMSPLLLKYKAILSAKI
jgi:hypothetical protein